MKVIIELEVSTGADLAYHLDAIAEELRTVLEVSADDGFPVRDERGRELGYVDIREE
jgi:hypothetical protein